MTIPAALGGWEAPGPARADLGCARRGGNPGLRRWQSLVSFLTETTPAVWRKALLLEHGGPSLTPASSDPLLEPQACSGRELAVSG